MCRRKYAPGDFDHLARSVGIDIDQELADLRQLDAQLVAFGIGDWCEYDLGIVRGLAYYTGTVFEVHEISGAERAMAGGGRYDRLIELMGGPSIPAVGFGMGDVVLSLVLGDRGLLPENALPAVDAFVIAPDEAAADMVGGVVATLRAAGLHARFSYKTTRNAGKLFKEADQHQARFAVILDGRTVDARVAGVKDMASGDQGEVPLADLPDYLQNHGGNSRE
jgi:histidyl-tRNA synthetase